MRISRDILLKNARNAVVERSFRDRSLVCVYLTGSLLGEDVLLGGTTDIDLVFIHDGEPAITREMVRLTEEVHLDIAHLSQQEFLNTRQLRANPWLGIFLCKDPILLHNKNHWFEFTQASVCAQFAQPDNILRRARPLLDLARQSWVNLGQIENEPAAIQPQDMLTYLKALENAANAFVVLTGAPLTERRFLLHLPERAKILERPALAQAFSSLFADQQFSESDWQTWIEDWQSALLVIAKKTACPPRLHACRRAYYVNAAEALHSDFPAAALWIILRTWTLAASRADSAAPELRAWNDLCLKLQLGAEHFQRRLNEMDSYLDAVEVVLEEWASNRGINLQIEIP